MRKRGYKALGLRARRKRRLCPHCGRLATTCWIMPCLNVEIAIAEAEGGDKTNLTAWADAVGGKLIAR